MKRSTSFIALAVAIACGLPMTAAAQDYGLGGSADGYFGVPEPSIEVPQPAVDHPPDAFGGNWEWTVFHSSRFVPFNGGSVPGYAGFGYIHPSNSGDDFWAQINLPIGAEIITVMWQVYDGTATGYWPWLNVVRYQAAREGTTPDLEIIQSLSTGSAEAPGYVLLQDMTPFPVTVRAYEDIDGSGGSDFVTYALTAESSGASTSVLRLFGATIVWTRVISPAPGSASFPDVGTGFWAFREIEALADSGITTGFPDGTFRPLEPVTRAQMATFLARALGLHFPY
jgi:hypothetical protein